MKNFFHLILISFLICTACELTIDVGDDLDYQDQLVIGALLRPDSAIRVSVARSQFILEEQRFDQPSRLQVTDATVRVYENGILLGETSESSSLEFETFARYSFPFSAVSGRTYRIEVERSGYPTATAEETISQETAVATISNLNTNGTFDQFGGYVDIDFTVELEDPLGDDYYQIVLFGETQEPYFFDTDTGFVEVTDSLRTVRYELYTETNSVAVEEYLYNQLIFDDRLFNGSNFSIRCESDFWFQNGVFEVEPKLVIQVNKLSESYYNYITTTELQSWLDGDPFAEPVQIYSNVEGGLGFLGSYTSVLIEVPIE